MAERDTTNLPMKVYTFSDTLSTPAENTNDEKRVVSRKSCTFIYTLATVNTNAVIGVQISADGTNFGADPKSPNVTHLANGTFVLTFTGSAPYVALVFVSESGGTAAVITIHGAIVAFD